MPIDAKLVRRVWERAHHCCEYCHLPQQVASIPFEIDHIVADQHQGHSKPNNLALACFPDNRCKGPNLGGIDPKTKKKIWLFNPRRHKWDRHFRWEGAVLIGRTAIGRVTIEVLQINAPHRIAQRSALMEEGMLFRK